MLKIINKIILFLILIIIIAGCETTTKPIIYDRNLKTVDDNIKVIYQLLSDKNYNSFETEISKYLELFPDNSSLLLLKAWYLLQTQKYSMSEELFLSLLEKNKKNILCYAGLARLYRIQNKKEMALDSIEKAMKISKFFSIVWFEKGLIEFESNDYEKAIISFTRAINLDNKNNDAKFFRFISFIKTGREFDEIKVYWEEIIKIKKPKVEYYIYYANTFYEIEKYKNFAVKVLKEGLEAYPNNIYILNMYSFLLLEKYYQNNDEKILNEAYNYIIKCFETSNDIEPEFIDTYLSILEAKKDYKSMKQLFDKYYIIFPDSDMIIKWYKKIEEIGK